MFPFRFTQRPQPGTKRATLMPKKGYPLAPLLTYVFV